MARPAGAQREALGLAPEAVDALKEEIMAEMEAKLSQKDESLWRRGQVEIRRLQSEQQQINDTISKLQESQAQLVVENQKIRSALLEVTSKFELVVKELRGALRALPQHGRDTRDSPTPSVASTSASDVNGGTAGKRAVELTPESGAGVEQVAAWSGEELAAPGWPADAACWPAVPLGWVLPEAPSAEPLADGAGGAEVSAFCTPKRAAAGAGNSHTESTAAALGSSEAPPRGSPAVLSLASALHSAPAASGLKRLQLAECLPDAAATPAATGSPPGKTRPGGGLSATPAEPAAPQPPVQAPATERAAGIRMVELVKEPGFVTLGVEVNTEGPFLTVESIDEHGLVGRHNLRQTSEALRVRVGDRIMEANGVSGDPSKMLQECKNRQRIVFGIALEPAGEAPRPAPDEQAEELVSQLRPEAQVFVPFAHSEASTTVPAHVGIPPGLTEARPEPAWGLPVELAVPPVQPMFLPGDLSPLAAGASELSGSGGHEQEEVKRTLFP